MNKRESREIYGMALQSFIASGAPIKRELDTVPACKWCNRIPVQYARLSENVVECIGIDERKCTKYDNCQGAT